MKTIIRLLTVAFPFAMSAAAFYVGVTRVSEAQPPWGLLILASIIGTALSALNAHAVICYYEEPK